MNKLALAELPGERRAMFEEKECWAPLPGPVLTSPAAVEAQGSERVKHPPFPESTASPLPQPTEGVPRRGSAQGKQTLIKSHSVHASASSC